MSARKAPNEIEMHSHKSTTPVKRTPKSFLSKWAQVLGAFAGFYTFLACLTVALFSIAMAILFPAGDPRAPCPFVGLELTNCYNLCAGPPQLMSKWSAAAVGSAERVQAASEIEAWIAGNHTFVWGGADASEFDGLTVTNQFYRKLKCCKLRDGVALTQANVEDETQWDDAFNNNDDERGAPTCNSWLKPENRGTADTTS
jgi:hypothetical protein